MEKMKNLLKKLVATIMSLGMMFSIVACGGNNDDNLIPLDIDLNNKPQLNIMLQATGHSEETLNSSYEAGVIQKYTGYQVNYSQLPATEVTTAVQLALINRSPYHAIKVTKQQFNMLLADDALLDIKPALDTYGGYLLDNIVKENWDVVSYNGGVYGIPDGGTFRKGQVNVVDCLIFREDLLFDAGFDIPDTLEEFTEVLRYFKQEGGANYYPLTIPSYMDGTEIGALVPSIAVAFDIYQYWSKVGDEYVYYLDHPNYKDYMEYMIGLYNEGLIDLDVMTQDKTGSISKFGKGDAVAMVSTTDEIPAILSMLRSYGEIAQDAEDLAVVGGLKDSKGEVHTYHRGGFSYVTVIPRYMNEQAAYTVDWLTKKLTKEAYTELMIGVEGENYEIKPDGKYVITNPIPDAIGGYFVTGQLGSNDLSEVFYSRIRDKENFEYFMQLNEKADEQGTYNPILFSNHLGTYDSKMGILNDYAREQAMIMMFQNKSTANYETVLAKWKADGGALASQEVTTWCKNNFDGKVKVN